MARLLISWYFAAVAMQRGPVTDGFAYLYDCVSRAGGLRSFGGDIQIVIEGTFKPVNFFLKRGARQKSFVPSRREATARILEKSAAAARA